MKNRKGWQISEDLHWTRKLPITLDTKVFIRCALYNYIGRVVAFSDHEVVLDNATQMNYEHANDAVNASTSMKKSPNQEVLSRMKPFANPVSISRTKIFDATYFDGPLPGEEQE